MTRTYSLPLKERWAIAEATMAFRLDTSGTGFTFRPGQYADFTLVDPPETDAEGNTRTFSIASSPGERDSITIATRMRPTAFKNSLKRVPLGTPLQVTAAMGSFTLQKDRSRPAVFLAGGIGITPMRSIIQWATEARLPQDIVLLYSNNTPATTAFLDDLERWVKENERLKLVPTITASRDPEWRYELGFIDAAMLRRHVADLARPIYYVAGPPAMVTAMQRLLETLGVSEDNVKTEEFAGY